MRGLDRIVHGSHRLVLQGESLRKKTTEKGSSPDARAFTPHASFKLMMDAELRRYSERPPELQPTIDTAEAFLLAVFLRRYVTYCARRGRYAAMNGAARLFDEVRASAG